MRLRDITHEGTTYYFYPSDVVDEWIGEKRAYAQDINGNSFTIIWNDKGTITEIIPD